MLVRVFYFILFYFRESTPTIYIVSIFSIYHVFRETDFTEKVQFSNAQNVIDLLLFSLREIQEQLYDIGAFGYGGQRTVEIKPFLYFFILPTPIDTLSINKEEWEFVNKQGDIKFP